MADHDINSRVGMVKDQVDQLYNYRDHYFDKFGIEKAIDKAQDVIKQMEKTFEVLEKNKDAFTNKAEYLMLAGKTLNVTPDFDQKAEDYLSKAVKLDPKLVEAWNHLGESYWKKGNVKSSKNCFTGALTHSKNKVSLRNLSMVLRQLDTSPAERAKNIEESVERAKEAVQLDISDGMSWLILGNAYLSLFFASGQNPKVLSQAMSAYKQAEKDPVAKNNADLYYNRSTAYKFQEDFQAALDGFSQAKRLDPTWKDPEIQEKMLLNYLTSVIELMDSKGKIKGKRLQTLAQSPRESALGPYAGGSYTSQSGKTIKLERRHFSQLQEGMNAETVVAGKVACTVPSDDPVPFTFCMLDEEETCFPVNVYNIAPGSGVKIGDTVALPEPFLQHNKVTHKGIVYEFQSIRVNTPVVMVVNGRKLGREKQAATVLSVSAMSG